MEPSVFVALIGEGLALAAMVGAHRCFSLEDLARRHDLVARVAVERRDARIPIVVDLRLEVPSQDVEAPFPRVGFHRDLRGSSRWGFVVPRMSSAGRAGAFLTCGGEALAAVG